MLGNGFVMTRAPQKRKVQTRGRMLDIAREIVEKQGFAALRVEDVVAGAQVAKGTFFSHFQDKDGILIVLAGEILAHHLDDMTNRPAPESLDDMMTGLEPLVGFLASDRIVFDIFIAYSGAIRGPAHEAIAQSLERATKIFTDWTTHMTQHGLVRQDVDPARLAEGILAFKSHVLALHHCTDAKDPGRAVKALGPFLREWLVLR